MIDGVTGSDHGEPHLDAGHCHHLRQHPAGGNIPEAILLTFTIFQSLPATPYFKMIDIWLFFSMNLMVVSSQGKKEVTELWQVVCLIFHTYLEYVVQTVEKSEKRYQLSPFPKRYSCFRLTQISKLQHPSCAQSDLNFCPHTHSFVKLSVPMSTEDRRSRQCMSQCPMTVPGALCV